MRSRPGLALAVAAVVAAAAVVWVSVRTARPGKPGPAAPTAEQQPSDEETAEQPRDMRIDGVEMTQMDIDTGNIIWRLRAESRFEYDESTQTWRANNIRWELDRADQETLIVEAPEFAARYKEKRIDFAGGVRAYTQSKSQIFEVDTLRYEFDTQKLIGQGSVRFRVGSYEASGKRLVFDNRRAEVRIMGPGRFARSQDS